MANGSPKSPFPSSQEGTRREVNTIPLYPSPPPWDLRDQAAQGTQVPREVSKTSLIMLADLSQMKRTPGDLQNIYRKQKGANTMKVPPFPQGAQQI